MKSIRNIGILAHVDAGKTSVTENLLFLGGVIRQMGSVDAGSAITDDLPLEKERGISIRSAANTLTWQEHQINLIDTPGHTDFFGEVDRVLGVLDGAILLISAVEGIQAATYLLMEACKYYQLPMVVMINKIDRPGSDVEEIITSLQTELNISPFVINEPINEGNANVSLQAVHDNSIFFESNLEALAETNDDFLNRYFDGDKGSFEEQQRLLTEASRQNLLVSVYCGSAKMNLGMEDLLTGVIHYLRPAKQDASKNLLAKIFKIEHDKTMGRLAHVRVFSGKLTSRDAVHNQRLKQEEKIAQIHKNAGKKRADQGSILAGDIGVLSGLTEAHPGDLLGQVEPDRPDRSFQQPVLEVKVQAENKEETQALADALTLLSVEDPFLNFTWFKGENEMLLKLMGAIQQEVLQGVLNQRFGLASLFDPPTVIYKETPLTKARGYVEYTMPKPCWAVMEFEVEALPLGSGVEYSSTVSGDKIHKKYQNEVAETIDKVLKQGIKGWQVDDIKITLVGGEDHVVHSRPGDFILATHMGLLRAIEAAGTQLLEPVYKYVLNFSEEYLGPITSELTKSRGSFNPPIFTNTDVRLEGLLPVATSQDFPLRLNTLSSGRARIRLNFGGYQACTEEQGQTREFRGVNPLEESLWILHNRGAYKAHER